ncbi:hypothetical protein RhiirA4_483013 [Rhizophagus irregularis]|uniref:Uncharacterized protein n=1 Tax=Rhizophagus irregularis TaxID=588596 RepID=A0A2I1HM03_9GLOM|nr:hypothetical protein RhiirA4_483013 [Rhizophagus irregularis]
MDKDFTADIAVADMGLDTSIFQPIVLIPTGSFSPDDTDVMNKDSSDHIPDYIGKTKTIGKDEFKRLIIHFYTVEDRNTCINDSYPDLADIKFHAHDLRQLKFAENLQAIQVTDIPFFIFKDDIIAMFKRFSNIDSCYLYAGLGKYGVQSEISLSANTKDIDLALFVRQLSGKAVNVPLFFNSYKPKKWVYITFSSQELLDTAME